MRAINIALLRSADNPLEFFRRFDERSAHRVIFTLLLAAAISLHAQQPSTQSSKPTDQLKSEVIAPGVEHLQIIRGYKSEKEATGPWFINMLRIDLSAERACGWFMRSTKPWDWKP